MKSYLAIALFSTLYFCTRAQYYGYSNNYSPYYNYLDYEDDYSQMSYPVYEPEYIYQSPRQARGGGKGGFWYIWGPGYGGHGGGGGGGHGGGGHGGGGYGGGGGGGGYGGGGGGGGGGGWGWGKPHHVKHIHHAPPKIPHNPPPIIHAPGPLIKRHRPVHVGWGWGGHGGGGGGGGGYGGGGGWGW